MKPNRKVSNMDLCTNLIREVKVRPPLWNDKDENWRNRDLVCKLWNEVGTVVGIPGPIARTKWNNLKDKYNCETGKQIAAMDCNCEFKSKWPLFEAMKFLDSSINSLADPTGHMMYANMDKNCHDSRINKRFFNQAAQNLGQLNGIVDLCEICKHSMQQHAYPNPNGHGHCNDLGNMHATEVKRQKQLHVCKDMRKFEEEHHDNQDIKVYVQKKPNKNESSSSSVCRQPDLVVALSQSKQSDCFNEEHNIGQNLSDFCSDMPCSDQHGRNESALNRPIKALHAKADKSHNKPSVQKATKKNEKIDKVEKVEKLDAECQNSTFMETKDKSITPLSKELIIHECERKENPNCQFLLSLVPYLDQLSHVDCLEVRSQIQCLINDAYRRREPGYSHTRRT